MIDVREKVVPPPAIGPIAVVMSRFPKFTETFVANEIFGLERNGAAIEIFPLLGEQRGPRQPAVGPLVDRARFGSPWGARSFTGFARVLARKPAVLLSVVAQLVRDTWRSPKTLAKDLALLPRICAVSIEMSALSVRHVHAHFLTHGGFAAWCLGRLIGVPYSVVGHGSDVHRNRAMMKTKVLEASFVATVSDFNRRVIIDECGAEAGERVVTVRCGVDLNCIVRRKPRPRPASPMLLCVGTLHEVKGQRYLIDAVALLAREGCDVDVQLVGTGPDRSALASHARACGVAGRIELVGALSHDEVLTRYHDADVVVVPSIASSDGRREGIPTVLMEAMASGVPVVASRLAGIPELVEDGVTGLLAEPGSPRAIADAVRLILESPDLAVAISNAAHRRVVSEYSLTQTTSRILELIDAAGERAGTIGESVSGGHGARHG